VVPEQDFSASRHFVPGKNHAGNEMFIMADSCDEISLLIENKKALA
jgi:hypothetical protein